MAARMDSEKASVAVLTKAVEERDKQLELLQAQLEKATAELDTNTAIIEDMKAEMNKGKFQGISQDLETGCPKLAIVKLLGILFFKGDDSILQLQPKACIYLLR